MTTVTIQSWMRTQLKLSGNELIVYAIIYGATQDGDTRFAGSRSYLADWCGCSVRSIQTILNNLTEKGFLTKYERLENKVKKCEYVTNFTGENISLPSEKISLPPSENFAQGGEKVALKHISNTSIQENKEKDNNNSTIVELLPAEPAVKKKNLYEKCLDCIDEYTENESIRIALREYLSLRLSMKDKPIYGVNQWKGLLKKLREICSNNADKALTVIDESIARGWATFVNPTSKYSVTQKSQSSVTCEIKTEEDIRQQEEFIEQLKAEGKQWQF